MSDRLDSCRLRRGAIEAHLCSAGKCSMVESCSGTETALSNIDPTIAYSLLKFASASACVVAASALPES